jgi:hypothetical protein
LKLFSGARARLALLAIALVVALVVAVAVRDTSSSGASGTADVGKGGHFERVAYEGLGAWVDVFDYAPAYQQNGLAPTVTPQDVDAMAALGVKTLYLQAARLDDKSPDGIVDADLIGQFLEHAHAKGIRVVGWYLPKFAALDADLSRLEKIADFEWKGQRFDGVTVDIEDTGDVPNVADRNARLVELSRRFRESVGSEATLGAAVLPPVQLELINQAYWPTFPWKDIAPYYDVWLPMTYWSVRKASSGWQDGYRYVVESVRRLRLDLGQPDAAVHPIGGIGDAITEDQVRDYLRALTDTDSIGGSIYDYRTMSGGLWGVLRTYLPGALAAPPGPTTSVADLPTTTTTTVPGATTTTVPGETTTTAVGATTTTAPGATVPTTTSSSEPGVTTTVTTAAPG